MLFLEGMMMNAIRVKAREPSMSTQVKKMRLSRLLTQQELADVAGVSRTEVNRFEQGLPLPLNSKRKILKELWSQKTQQQ